jgi:subtilisin-like proprotein convertase family protein
MIFKFTSLNSKCRMNTLPANFSLRWMAGIPLLLSFLFLHSDLQAQCSTNALNTNVVFPDDVNRPMNAASLVGFVQPTGGGACLILNFYQGATHIPGNGLSTFTCDESATGAGGLYAPGTYIVVADTDFLPGGNESPPVIITVSFTDITNPVITCPANTTAECNAVTPATTGMATATDNCTIDANISITHTDATTPGSCSQEYTITRTWRATDDAGNTHTCVQTIMVDDTTNPIITCPAAANITCSASTAPANTGTATATDNCGTPTVTSSDIANTQGAPGTCAFYNYSITRRWTATDACGNTATCNQTITVTDNTAPTITCPAPETLECDDNFAPGTDLNGTASASAAANSVTWPDANTGLVGTAVANVAGIPMGATITDVNVVLRMDHSWVGDLNLTLVSPSGATVTFIDNPCAGGNSDNINATFDSQGAAFLCTSGVIGDVGNPNDCSNDYLIGSAINGTIQTQLGSFNGFNGSTMGNGNWQLQVRDEVGGDGGCLIAYSVSVNWNLSGIGGDAVGVATATDNCTPSPTITYTDVAVGQGAVGCSVNEYTINRTWIATDICGNSSTCVQVLTIVDNTPPVFTSCPANINVSNDAGNCSNSVSWLRPTFTDACPQPGTLTVTTADPKGNNTVNVLQAGLNDFADFGVGTSIVSYTATDACGNSSTCSFTVTVLDTEAPIIICPANATLDFSSCNANAMIPDYRAGVGVADNCSSGFTITQIPAPGTLLTSPSLPGITPADGELITITFTVTDNAANNGSATCSFVVTLNEDSNPVPSTPGGILPIITSECGPITIDAPTAVDACGNLLCGEPFPASVATNVGPACAGPTGPCVASSRSSLDVPKAISDNTPAGVNSVISVTGLDPIIEDVNISLAISHTWVGDLRGTLTAPNGTTVVLFDQPGVPASIFGCAENNMSVTFDDAAALTAANLEATCVAQNPALAISGTFQSVVPLSMFNNTNPNGTWTLNISDVVGGDVGTITSWTLDLCTNATSQQVTQYEFGVGTHNFAWIYDDGFGNTASQNQTIIVTNDVVDPTVTCADLTVELDANGNASIVPGDVLAASGITIVGGNDGSFNFGTTNFSITVPAPVTLSFDWAYSSTDLPGFDGFATIINGGAPTFLSVTDGDSGSQSIALAAGSTFTFSVQTADNLFGAGQVVITNIDPELTGFYNFANWIFTNNNADGIVTPIPGSATDNCTAPGDLIFSVSPSTFDCGDIGDNIVTVSVTDEAGNVGTCTATVTVEDNLAPVILSGVPANITSGITCNNIPVNNAIVLADDNCDNPVVNFTQTSTQSGNPFNCQNYTYVITRTWTASDNGGNSTSASQTIQVTDNSAPTNITFAATGPAGAFSDGAIINPNLNQCVATVSLFINGLTDCASINTMDFTYQIDGGAVVNGNGFNNVQFSAAAHTVVFTVTDPCNNTATATFNFTVTDGIEPVASCVNSLNIGLPSSGILVLSPNAVNNNSFDNCTPSNLLILTLTPDTFTCADVGLPIDVELFVSDGALVSSCITTVTIQDNIDPTAICKPITISLDGNGMASITPADVDNGSFDNCNANEPDSGIGSMSLSQSTFDLSDAGTTTNVILTVEDYWGNTDVCTAAVTVIIDQTCFDVGAAIGGAGQIVNLPVTVEAFTNVTGFQFSFDIDPDNASIDRGEFVGVANIHPSLSTNFLVTFDQDVQPTNTALDTLDVAMPLDSIIFDTLYFTNTINISWQGLPEVDLADGTTAFDLQILLTGNIGEVGVVSQIEGVIPEVSYNYSNNFFFDEPCFVNGGFLINKFIIAGEVVTETGDPVGMVTVDLDKTNAPLANQEQVTLADGQFEFEVFSSGNYKLTPVKNIFWKNGVNIDDVVKMQQHAVGGVLLNSAYKKIAADANNDGLITTFDAVITNNFVLNFISGATPPPNQSWRFVDAKQVLVNAPNALVPAFNEMINFTGLITDTLNNDFIGVKIGDLTEDANPATFNGDADTKSDKALKFVTTDARTVADETVSIDFTAKDFHNLVGYQWALAFDADVLSFESMKAGSLTNLSDGNVGTASLKEGLVFFTWYTTEGVTATEDEVLFTLNFHAKKGGMDMKDLIELRSFDGFNLAAFDAGFVGRTIELSFVKDDKGVDATYVFELLQNQPNPFKAETTIGFTLPYNTFASIEITDATGRLLKVIEGDFVKGYNEVTLTKNELSAAGVLYYQLETTEFTATRKMIIID